MDLADPASVDALDMQTILQNIRRSFHAFHDDDKNDHDDAGEHHS